MIIEVKDLPEGQIIDKIDIHIDFQKGTTTVEPKYIQDSKSADTETASTADVPPEMVNAEF